MVKVEKVFLAVCVLFVGAALLTTIGFLAGGDWGSGFWPSLATFLMMAVGIGVGGTATVLILVDKGIKGWVWTIICFLLMQVMTVLVFVGINAGGLKDLPFWGWVSWVGHLSWTALALIVMLAPATWARGDYLVWSQKRKREHDARELELRRQEQARKAREEEEQARQRKAELRRQEVEHAERVEAIREEQRKEREALKEASTPGDMTGYEPQELAGLTLVRPEIMYGDPGAGLSGSGFDESAVRKGQEGEINFAKSLQKAGLLERFASFWSVHMPEAGGVGASKRMNTDIDCVLLTGATLWLLDMKNYQQGGVRWELTSMKPQQKNVKMVGSDGKPYDPSDPAQQVADLITPGDPILGDLEFIEAGGKFMTKEEAKALQKKHAKRAASAPEKDHLIAFDREKDVYVGRPRSMSTNMDIARQNFEARLHRNEVPFEVKPVVVMMPREDGLGTIEGLFLKGDIPIVGLPALLDWLREEPDFDGTSEDSLFMAGMLRSLLKDESGSAVR